MEELRALLRRQGLRATSPRLDVLAILHDERSPMTHEALMERLPGSFDRASVWRILAQLGEKGLLRRMDLGDRIWRYELYDACRAVAPDHAHFLCEGCGDVQCLPALFVRDASGAVPVPLRGADVRIRVTGQCADCASG